MNEMPRKKSPRAPSIPLDEAVERALKVYEKERRHATPTDVVAQNLGYKSANNGSALSVIAALRSYGLLEKVQDAKLAVSKDVEAYRFAPSEDLRSALRIKWLKAPNVFTELLDKYADGFPSDASLRFDLIQRGFTPATAESTLNILKKSVEFARFFEQSHRNDAEQEQSLIEAQPEARESRSAIDAQLEPAESAAAGSVHLAAKAYDRIPVRLSGGRRAWLEIPTPFYEADKKRLKAQIDLLLTEDEEDDPNSE